MPKRKPIVLSGASQTELTGSDFLGLNSATVVTLPVPAAGDTDAVIKCTDAAFSGGVGCILHWDGSAWRDPDGNIASATLNPVVITSFVAGRLTKATLAANVLTIMDDPANSYFSTNSGAAGANQYTKLFSISAASSSRVNATVDVISVGTTTNAGDLGRIYFKGSWGGTAGVDPLLTMLYDGMGLLIDASRFIAVVEQNTPTPVIGIYYRYTSNSEVIRYRPQVESRVGTPGMTISYLEAQGVIASLPAGTQLIASQATATHLHTSSQITDFTEAVQDALNTAATDSTFIDVIYDDLTNTYIWTLIDGSITEGKLSSALAAKVNGDHSHSASQISDFAEALDDRVAALLQAGSNITLTYDDVTNTLTISSTPGPAGAGGSDRQIQFNDAGVLAGSSKASIDTDGEMLLGVDATVPATPPTGKAKFYAAKVGGRSMLGVRGASGLHSVLQPHVGRNSVSWWLPVGNAATIVAMGAAALTITGTATTESVADTNLYTRSKRVSARAVAAANAVAGWRHAVAQNTRNKGFHKIWRYGFAQGVSNASHRSFVGFSALTAAPTDVNPSTLTDVLGLGCDAADTNLQIMHRTGAGGVNKIDLGASFPKPSVAATDIYELVLYSSPLGSSVFYAVTNLETNAFTEGEITSSLPAVATLLAPRMVHSSGGVSNVVGITLMSGYIETDL